MAMSTLSAEMSLRRVGSVRTHIYEGGALPSGAIKAIDSTTERGGSVQCSVDDIEVSVIWVPRHFGQDWLRVQS